VAGRDGDDLRVGQQHLALERDAGVGADLHLLSGAQARVAADDEVDGAVGGRRVGATASADRTATTTASG
jgi:hypothetical protein